MRAHSAVLFFLLTGCGSGSDSKSTPENISGTTAIDVGDETAAD